MTFKLQFNDGKPMVFSDEVVAAIKTGQFWFFVYGKLEYRDDFTLFGNRELGYCFRWNPDDVPGSSFDGCKEREYTYAR